MPLPLLDKAPKLPEGAFCIRAKIQTALDQRLDKLNRRAAKLGVAPVGYKVFHRYLLKISVVDPLDPELRHTEIHELLHVIPTGSAPKLAGWTFAATVQHEDAGNVLRKVATFQGTLPLQYRQTTPDQCDHCKQLRKRNDTYILQHDDGRWMQVGRTCLRDFLGHASPEAVAAWASMLGCIESVFGFPDADVYDGLGGRAVYHMPLDVLTIGRALTRETGYVSKRKAEERMIPSTASLLWGVLHPYNSSAREEAEKVRDSITANDKLYATAALDWAQGIPDTTTEEYLWNLRVVSHMSAIPQRSLGMCVSILSAYSRALSEKTERQTSNRKSEHFGTVGKREEFTLELERVTDCNSQFGPAWLCSFLDSEGRSAKWFASNQPSMFVGSRYKVKASVKAHTEYKGWAQTSLTRLKVLAEITPATEPQPTKEIQGELSL
jgi:hypothetical protein